MVPSTCIQRQAVDPLDMAVDAIQLDLLGSFDAVG